MARYSGKTMVRMDPDLHRRLAQEALDRAISLNQLLIEYLQVAWLHRHSGSWLPEMPRGNVVPK